jgi:hypothetical protein
MKTLVHLSKDKQLPVYAGVHFKNAVREVTDGMDLYRFGKLTVLLEGVYLQGKKDGARIVDESFTKMMKHIPHNNPGQPKKKSQ